MNLLRKAATWIARRWSIEDPRGLGAHPAHSGEIVTENSALHLSTVWSCVNLLGGTIASLPIEVKQRVRGTNHSEIVVDHPLGRVLGDSPNFDQTGFEFWEGIAYRLELRGNAYARKVVASDGRLISLEPINADVAVTRLASGDLEYRWSEDGKSWVGGPELVFHLRGFGGHPLGGISTLAAARHAFGLSQAIERAAGSTFANGLRPSGVLAFPTFLSKENRKTAETEMVEKFAGSMNAGKPMVLEGGATWTPVTINPEDAQMLESRTFSVEDLCRFFGVPPFLVGHTSKATSFGTGIEQQMLAFLMLSLRKRLKRIEASIEKHLLTPADRALGTSVSFNIEGLLRADSAARAAFYGAMAQNGIMTINECRAREGLPPVPGGDVPRMQAQNVPITSAGIGPNGGPLVDGGSAP